MFLRVRRVSQYGGRCDWLKNDQFLRDLEGDSVDAEILDEELRLLQEQQPKTYDSPTKHYASCPIQIIASSSPTLGLLPSAS